MGKKRKRESTPEQLAWLGGVRKRMKAVRERLGLSHRQAAEMTGVHFSNISRAESGGAEPTIAFLVELAEGYGIDPGELLVDPPADGTHPAAFRIPCPGAAGAGPAVDAEPDPDGWLDMAWAHKDGVLAVRIRGDSMVGQHIVDGDWVIVRPDPDPPSGVTVLAYGRDQGHVIKKLLKRGGEYRLLSADGSKGYLLADNTTSIVGVFLGLVRRGK